MPLASGAARSGPGGRRARLAAARGVAEAAQRAVLPTPPDRIEGLRLAGVSTLSPRSFGVPLGLSDLSPAPPEPDEWTFPAGATLLLYTDGLSGARDESGTFYDPADRLEGPVFSSPARLLGTLVGDGTRFTGGLATDDMALLAVHRPRGRAPR
ncbi:SpoIIE family protein phosphatase [Streptomyces sp. NPDC051079]|uniref:SpoIIE family protein phosphatase n=1 Tax=Streptomyces sp. NPDC051079 TaxID=3155043 RepID=UPI00344E012B